MLEHAENIKTKRLNVNDLLERRKAEKTVDKKTNLFIVSGISTVAVIILLLFSL